MTLPIEPPVDSLLRHAEAGALRLDDGVAGDCQRACEAMIHELEAVLHSTKQMSTIEAYGILPSARQLGSKFEAKAVGADGLRDVLRQHIATVSELRDLFDKAARAYRDADAHAADALVNTTGGS